MYVVFVLRRASSFSGQSISLALDPKPGEDGCRDVPRLMFPFYAGGLLPSGRPILEPNTCAGFEIPNRGRRAACTVYPGAHAASVGLSACDQETEIRGCAKAEGHSVYFCHIGDGLDAG